MATQGPRYPGTVANLSNAGSSENAEAWVTPTNVTSDNATEASITAATYDSPDISQLLVCSNFGFTIPSDGVITGITLEIDRRSIIAGSGKDFRICLAKGTTFASLVGSNQATGTTWPSTSTVATYAFGLWDTTWTVAEINAASFAVMISCQAIIANADVGIDFVRITIDYTVPPPAKTATVALTGGGVATIARASSRRLGTGPPVDTYRPAIMGTAGLVGYWRLGDTSGGALDELGANHGSYVGSIQSVPGALPFDNAGVRATAANCTVAVTAPTSALNLGDVVTMEVWINRDGVAPGGWGGIISKGSGAYYLRLNQTTGTLSFVQSRIVELATSSVSVPLTGWHHIVATKNGATIRMYIDGVMVTDVTTGTTLTNSGLMLFFGSDNDANWGGSEPFIGLMDEIAVYNVALSAADVVAHFSASGRERMLNSDAPSAETYDATTVGNRFTVLQPGKITAIRYWHHTGDGAFTHYMGIYNSVGTKVVTLDDACGGTATGWRTVMLPTPLTVAAGQTYTVTGYHAGWYYAYWSPTRTVSLAPNLSLVGPFYNYGANGFPTSGAGGTYLVDVVFEPVPVGGGLVLTGGGVVTVVGTGVPPPEVHTGTASLTGGGVVTVVGAKGAKRTQVMTGGGVLALTAPVKGAKRTQVMTGGGITVLAGRKVGRSAQVITGGGVVTTSGTKFIPERHYGTALLTGGGVVTATAWSARSRAVALTGGGTILYAFEWAEHRSSFIQMTGGGSITVAQQTARSTTLSVPGGGVVNPQVANPPVAADTFTRTLTDQWGTADMGGAWTVNTPSPFDVNGTKGTMSAGANNTRRAWLASVSQLDIEFVALVQADRLPAGAAFEVSLSLRQSNLDNDMLVATLGAPVSGRPNITLLRRVGGSQTVEAALTTLNSAHGHDEGDFVANADYVIHARATGSNPTTFEARAWKQGNTVPTHWCLTATITSAESTPIQSAGALGVRCFVGAASTAGTVLFSVEQLEAYVSRAVPTALTGGGVVVIEAVKFEQEVKTGSASLTGGGVIAVAGKRGAVAPVVATGGGTIVTAGTKAARLPVVATGGGVITYAYSTTSNPAKTGTASLTGGGIATVAGRKTVGRTVAATGSGVITLVGATGRIAIPLVATGGGVIVLTRVASKRGTAAATGGGVVSIQRVANRRSAATLTGSGVVVLGRSAAHRAQIAVTGGGTIVAAATAARSSAQTLTGGGRVLYTYSSGNNSKSGFIQMTGGGTVTIARRSARFYAMKTDAGGLADGAAVGTWVDRSGHANAVAQGSPDPVFKTNVLNGRGVVRTTASEGRYRAYTTGVNLDYTLVYVARVRDYAAGRVLGADYNTSSNFLLGWWQGLEDKGYGGSFLTPDLSNSQVPGAWRMYSADGAALSYAPRMFRDGTLIGNGVGWGSGFNYSLALGGYNETTAETPSADYAEIVLYSYKMSDFMRGQVENYLRAKWFGIGSSTFTPTDEAGLALWYDADSLGGVPSANGATGGGTVTVRGGKTLTGSAALTGGGVATIARRKGALRSQVMTGGGVITLTRRKGSAGLVALTGGGTAVTTGRHAGRQVVVATGGGVITLTTETVVPRTPSSHAVIINLG